MKSQSVLKDKSFQFSLMVIKTCRFLKESNVEYSICRQLLRSGTAIGALVAEAEFAQSRADFISKLSIALKEANETKYWISLIIRNHSVQEHSVLESETLLEEIIRMLVASIRTAKNFKA